MYGLCERNAFHIIRDSPQILSTAFISQQPFSVFKFIRCCSRCVCVINAIAVIIIISGYSDFIFHSYPYSWWDLWATSISPYNHLVSQQWQQQQHPVIRERKMHFKLFKFPLHVHNIFYCVCFGIYPSLSLCSSFARHRLQQRPESESDTYLIAVNSFCSVKLSRYTVSRIVLVRLSIKLSFRTTFENFPWTLLFY